MPARTTLFGLLVRLAVACPLAAAAAPAATAIPAAETASVRPNAAVAPNGKQLFAAACAPCHGEAGRGDGPEAQYFIRPPRDLRSGVLDRYTTEELVERIRSGAPLRLELDPPAMRQRARDVESLVAFMQRLPDIDWTQVEPGNDVFLERCEVCHGPFGRPAPGMTLPPGVKRAPRDLSTPEFQRSVSDRELVAIVQHGREGMPAIPALQSRSDADVLIAFVRTLSPGRELYGVYCSGCHGEDGRGPAYLPEGLEAPQVVFDRAYFARVEPEQLRTKVWHMLDAAGPSMPHLGRRLDEPETRAIIEYLRTTAAPTPTPR